METIRCPLCGNDSLSLSITAPGIGNSSERYSIVKCGRCQLQFTNPRPTLAEIADYYPSDYHTPFVPRYRPIHIALQYMVLQTYYQWPVKYPRVLARAFAALFDSYLGRSFPYSSGKRLLDIGCGNGEFLLWVQRMDPSWSLTGTELSSVDVEIARKYHLDVSQGTVEAQKYDDQSFDVVTLWNVLEHLHDPIATLQEIHRILRPGGALSLVVPNIASAQFDRFREYWWVLQLPQHLIFFDRDTLCQALQQSGFKVLRLRNRAKTYSHQSLLRKAALTCSKVSKSRLLLEKTLDNFRSGDLLKVVAVKP